MFEEYLKAVDSLPINDEHRLRRKVEELTTKTSDEALKQRVEKMSKTLAALEKWALHNEQGEHDMYRDELEDLFEKS